MVAVPSSILWTSTLWGWGHPSFAAVSTSLHTPWFPEVGADPCAGRSHPISESQHTHASFINSLVGIQVCPVSPRVTMLGELIQKERTRKGLGMGTEVRSVPDHSNFLYSVNIQQFNSQRSALVIQKTMFWYVYPTVCPFKKSSDSAAGQVICMCRQEEHNFTSHSSVPW